MKKINFTKIIVAFIIGVCYFATNVTLTPAFAEDKVVSSTLTVSPMYQKIILTPGETYVGIIDVSTPNSATLDLDYSLSVGSFSQRASKDSKDDYGVIDTDTISDYNQIIDWITLDRENGSIAPNNVDTVKFTIDVPKDAPAGGQYASILVQDDTDRGDNNSGNVMIQSSVQIASIIYAEVTGTTRNVGSIISNSIPAFSFSNELEATSTVRNDGNVHTDAKFTLQVWPIFSGEEICTNEEDPDISLIMPNTERYHTQTCSLPPVGIFKAKQTVRIFGEESTTEQVIIICPLWLLFIIIFAIVAVIIYFVMRSKSRKK